MYNVHSKYTLRRMIESKQRPWMKKNTELNVPIECKHTETINKLNEIIKIKDYLNIEIINCSYGLLKWSVSPLISKRRHNVVISSVKQSRLIKNITNISLVCSSLDRQELIKKLIFLAMNKQDEFRKTIPLISIRESDLIFYDELSALSGKMGKYRSNKKKRLIARLGLENDFELTLFFNIIYSIPYSMLRVRLLRDKSDNFIEREIEAKTCVNFKCKVLNLRAGRNSLLFCTAN